MWSPSSVTGVSKTEAIMMSLLKKCKYNKQKMWNDNKYYCVGRPKIIIPLSNAIWPSSSAHYPNTIEESFLPSFGSFGH